MSIGTGIESASCTCTSVIDCPPAEPEHAKEKCKEKKRVRQFSRLRQQHDGEYDCTYYNCDSQLVGLLAPGHRIVLSVDNRQGKRLGTSASSPSRPHGPAASGPATELSVNEPARRMHERTTRRV